MKTLMESLGSSLVDDSKYNIFVIVKPGSLGLIPEVVKTFEDKGWVLDRIRPKHLLLDEAKRLYDVHKKEDFYEDLCKYMSSDVSVGIIFTKDKPMSKKMFAETGKIKDGIRKKYGESEMRNVLHSSDSLERMQIERGIYF